MMLAMLAMETRKGDEQDQDDANDASAPVSTRRRDAERRSPIRNHVR